MDTETRLFQALMGKPHHLRPFQQKTVQALKDKASVILSAPTGTGKTWAALIAFLDGWIQGSAHADKVIYALPLRSLASGLYQSTREAIERAKKFPLFSEDEKARLEQLSITIQTGDQQEDPFFKGDICFTTIDQIFTGYLNIPASLPKRLANINAGAWVGALIVIDEIHLLDPQRSLATLIEIGRQLSGLTQMLLMSATLSKETLAKLSYYFQAEIIETSEDELMKMPSQAKKKRYFHFVDCPLCADHILATHGTGRTIVICNTVRRAQKIYYDLQKKLPEGCTLILLHSRFLKNDRRKKELQLSDWFGPDATKNNVILVATQVIEAGIDISAEVIHTELCPANSLLQRAGRCARFENRNEGIVYIYMLEAIAGKERLGPYRNLNELVTLTQEKVREFSGMNIRYQEEKEIVNYVHTGYELHQLSVIERNRSETHNKVLMTISTCDRSQVSELVRDIDSVSIFIHDDPNQLDILGGMEFLSIPRTSLFSLQENFDSNQGAWIAQKPILSTGDDEGASIRWETVKTFRGLFSAWLLIINPAFARYDSDMGLVLNEKGTPLVPVINPKEKLKSFNYSLETYKEHAEKTLQALNLRESSVKVARKILSQKYDIVEEKLKQIEKLLCILHDVGKLRKQYQDACLAWERERYPEHCDRLLEPLAHRTYNALADWQFKDAKNYRRGNHAVEGGFAICESLVQSFMDEFGEDDYLGFLIVFLTAVSRHHFPTAKGLTQGIMIPQAAEYLNKVFQSTGMDIRISHLKGSQSAYDGDRFKNCLLEPTDPEHSSWLPLYFYLIRRLRLADQESFEI